MVRIFRLMLLFFMYINSTNIPPIMIISRVCCNRSSRGFMSPPGWQYNWGNKSVSKLVWFSTWVVNNTRRFLGRRTRVQLKIVWNVFVLRRETWLLLWLIESEQNWLNNGLKGKWSLSEAEDPDVRGSTQKKQVCDRPETKGNLRGYFQIVDGWKLEWDCKRCWNEINDLY
jgi:hypothetical protein